MGKRYHRCVLAPLLAKPWPQAQLPFEALVAKIFSQGDPQYVYAALSPVIEDALADGTALRPAEVIAFDAAEKSDLATLDPRWFELAERNLHTDASETLRCYFQRLFLVAPHPERLPRLMAFAKANPGRVHVLRVLAVAGDERVRPMALERLEHTSNPYQVLVLLWIIRRFGPAPSGEVLVQAALRSLPYVRDETTTKGLVALVDRHGDEHAIDGLRAAFETLRGDDAPPAVLDRVEEVLETFCELFESERPSAPAVDPDAWPYLFYYPLPRAKVGDTCHDYEIRFESPPTGELRVRLAEAFMTAIRGSNVETRDAWRWEGGWLLLPLTLEPDEIDGWEDLAGPVRDGLAAMHAITPIAEVQCTALHTEPCKDPWHHWTEARQRTPSPAPRWGFPTDQIRAYTRQKRYDAEGSVDRAVEAVRRIG